ncbi:MAG: hypothetical protein HYS44_02575 [Candidatus Niyogibacteria bacterium]|nr:hypothetical protein [Candidatus Niyogibacteria bacterium]
MENSFSVRTLVPANPANDKGQRTWTWDSFGRYTTVYRRRKGEEFGGHFHKGDDPAKNPELFLLLSGAVLVKLVDKDGRVSEEFLNASGGPVELVIHPWIFHEVKALEDCVFIEDRGPSKFDPDRPDTYPVSEFPEHRLCADANPR